MKMKLYFFVLCMLVTRAVCSATSSEGVLIDHAPKSLQALILSNYAKRLVRDKRFRHIKTPERFCRYLARKEQVPQSFLLNVCGLHETESSGVGSAIFNDVASIIARCYYLRIKGKEYQKEMPAWLLIHFKGVSVQDLIDNDMAEFKLTHHEALELQERCIGSLYGIHNVFGPVNKIYYPYTCCVPDGIVDCKNVVDMQLFGNLLTEIPRGIFAEFVNLVRISLSNNRIKRIERDTFKVPSKVGNIYISNNPITEIASGAFADMPNLFNLNLRGLTLSQEDRERIEREVYSVERTGWMRDIKEIIVWPTES